MTASLEQQDQSSSSCATLATCSWPQNAGNHRNKKTKFRGKRYDNVEHRWDRKPFVKDKIRFLFGGMDETKMERVVSQNSPRTPTDDDDDDEEFRSIPIQQQQQQQQQEEDDGEEEEESTMLSIIQFVALVFALLTTNAMSFAFAFQPSLAAFTPNRRSTATATATATTCTFSLRMATTSRPDSNNNDNQEQDTPPTTTTMTSRRAVLHQSRLGVTAAVLVAATTLLSSSPQPAVAKYSDYTRREKDWQQRLNAGEVKISSARDLRRQLSEIAPMNDQGSQLFCPNGPSSAVSPLMENKCGDRLAIPSVYGRTQDTVGNSIPGFGTSRSSSAAAASGMTDGSSSRIAAEIGGFPKYNK